MFKRLLWRVFMTQRFGERWENERKSLTRILNAVGGTEAKAEAEAEAEAEAGDSQLPIKTQLIKYSSSSLNYDVSNKEHTRIAETVLRQLIRHHSQFTVIKAFTESHLSNVALPPVKSKSNGSGPQDHAPANSKQDRPATPGTADSTATPDHPNSHNKPNPVDESKKSSEPGDSLARDLTSLRNYRLAATDLFVEKALTYLEDKANSYNYRGGIVYLIGVIILLTAAFLASLGIVLGDDHQIDGWISLIARFTRAVTLYGLLVLAGSKLMNLGKAMLDQAERLFEKRHALRQGRLFIHLQGGEVTLSDMKEAFSWNVTQPNAFGDLTADAKAPWGALISETLKTTPELVKASAELVKAAGKPDGKGA